MAIKDRAVTIKGDQAQATCLALFPQANGDCVITIAGLTKDSDGRAVALKEAQIVYRPGQNDIVASLLAAGLDALRKTNGLEDAPIVLEPKADVVADAQAAPLPQPVDIPKP